MEAVCIKLEENLLTDIEQTMKTYRYSTKTEFIREAIRDKINELEQRQKILSAYGASRKKTTSSDLHKARQAAFAEIEKEIT